MLRSPYPQNGPYPALYAFPWGAPPPSPTAPTSTAMIVYAPGIANAVAPIFNDWNQIEAIVNGHQGACRIIFDATGLPGFIHVPATANLDGKGRLELVGGGPNGEAEVVIDNGGQIKNAREYRTIVFRAEPTIRSPIVIDLEGLIVECFDTTFLFDNGGGGTLPIISVIPPTYTTLLFYESSELRNSHNPGMPVIDIGAGVTVLWGINDLVFESPFTDTVSGPASATINLQVDASLPSTFSQALFLGTVTITQIDMAEGVTYTPAVVANWNGVAPANVQEALDRIAARIGPIP
jgi:hypothetical protein